MRRMLRQSERIRSANTALSTEGWAAGLQLAGAEHSTPWVATRSPTPMRYSNRGGCRSLAPVDTIAVLPRTPSHAVGRPGLADCSCDLSTLVHCVGQGYESATGIEPALDRLGLLSLRGCPGEWDTDAGGCGETLRPLVVFFACLLDECVDRLQTGAGGTDSR